MLIDKNLVILTGAGIAAALIYVGSRFSRMHKPQKVGKNFDYDPARMAGAVGEAKVASALIKLGSKYAVLNDLLPIPCRGRTAQIDHLVIAGNTIILIETKAWSGSASVLSRGKTWERYNKAGIKTGTVESPAAQSIRHRDTVACFIGEKHLKATLHPVVVFSNENMVLYGQDTVPAMGIKDLLGYIKYICEQADSKPDKRLVSAFSEFINH